MLVHDPDHPLVFLSTLSLRRATRLGCILGHFGQHFYPRSPCGERPLGTVNADRLQPISIHALLAESDLYPALSCRPHAAISIHALLAESDPVHLLVQPPVTEFLSTLSLRRATRQIDAVRLAGLNFYPRSPCGERPAPLADGAQADATFLSTLSLRRATDCLTGSHYCEPYFYPRSPCGERPARHVSPLTQSHFYPRSPCGERPPLADGAQADAAISIHALLAESDHTAIAQGTAKKVFLSTLSLRRATTASSILMVAPSNFYPRSPCGERPR